MGIKEFQMSTDWQHIINIYYIMIDPILQTNSPVHVHVLKSPVLARIKLDVCSLQFSHDGIMSNFILAVVESLLVTKPLTASKQP